MKIFKKNLIIFFAVSLFMISVAEESHFTEDNSKSEINIVTEKSLKNRVSFTWLKIGEEFYFEIKNGTNKVFKLDNIWVAGFNLEINGYDKVFKHRYKVYSGNIDLDRMVVKIVTIQSGESYREKFNLDHIVKTLPQNICYVDFAWNDNSTFYGGTKLPTASIKTCIYKIK